MKKSMFGSNLLFLLNLDPTAGGTITEGEDDILSADLAGIDTSYPVLKECLVDLAIESVTKVKQTGNKDDGTPKTGTNLVVKLKTTTVLKDVKDNDMNPGFTLTVNVSLTPTPKYDKAAILRALATFRQAQNLKEGPVEPLAQYAGKMIRAKITIRPAKGDFEMSNNVKFVPID